MNKKIKVIELLNIVARGKDIPKKIKVYLRKDGEQMPDYYIFNDYGYYENSKEESFVEDWLNNTMKLNEEVEILEDEEDNDISSLNAFKLMEAPYMAKCLDKNSHEEFMEHLKQSEVEIVHKIGELIEKVNKIDRKINKED